jgi:hypothetical protein
MVHETRQISNYTPMKNTSASLPRDSYDKMTLQILYFPAQNRARFSTILLISKFWNGILADDVVHKNIIAFSDW